MQVGSRVRHYDKGTGHIVEIEYGVAQVKKQNGSTYLAQISSLAPASFEQGDKVRYNGARALSCYDGEVLEVSPAGALAQETVLVKLRNGTTWEIAAENLSLVQEGTAHV